ncbi:hypothetical protein G7Z17_g11630 [Cylindrodendrum hubeiense]|uniref:Uncharacterized protein n=1 Tax=Cylindrodendrum hubeiense TaxID=595255 RepID=A0A9P5LBF9_9HYPO|nr:hypothetical protein G7Z17_g11630 [Cylindrodendrum hubeiense]
MEASTSSPPRSDYPEQSNGLVSTSTEDASAKYTIIAHRPFGRRPASGHEGCPVSRARALQSPPTERSKPKAPRGCGPLTDSITLTFDHLGPSEATPRAVPVLASGQAPMRPDTQRPNQTHRLRPA